MTALCQCFMQGRAEEGRRQQRPRASTAGSEIAKIAFT